MRRRRPDRTIAPTVDPLDRAIARAIRRQTEPTVLIYGWIESRAHDPLDPIDRAILRMVRK